MAGINDLLMSQKPLQTGASAMYPASEALKKRFTVMSRFGDPIQLWDESPDKKYIFLPRAVCPMGEKDVRVSGFPITVKSKFVPRNEEQATVVPEAIRLLKQGHSFLFEAPTGFGKTIACAHIICEVGVTTLVVCTKDDLIKQWKKRLLQQTDLKPSDIGLIQQDVCDVYGKKVVIGSVQSLAIPDRYPVGIRQQFGLVIFDECHRLGAETFSRTARMFPSKLRLGVSATPTRVDGKEIVFNAHIGPVRVRAKALPMIPKVLRYNTGWSCPRWKVDGKIQKLPHSPGKCGHVLKYITRDPVRNRLIVFLAKKSYDNGRRLVIFSDIIDHLELLQGLLKKAGVPSGDIGCYYGAMTGAKMDAALGKKIVLATPGKMGEGTDAPWIDACLLATPKSNIEQLVGRALREYPDKRQPVVFDLCDWDSPVFSGYAKKRDEFYKRVKASIKEMEAVTNEAAAA